MTEGELGEGRRNACKSRKALKQAIFRNQELCLIANRHVAGLSAPL